MAGGEEELLVLTGALPKRHACSNLLSAAAQKRDISPEKMDLGHMSAASKTHYLLPGRNSSNTSALF